jgi:simple sugar transport system ATP-binding protein
MQARVERITKTFGPVRANDDISMTFRAGSIYAILGENGAGKSTLMKILSGYQPPDSGYIIIDGASVVFRTPAEALAAEVSMLHQDPLDIPALTALDNFIFGQAGGLLPRRHAQRARFRAITEKLGFNLQPNALAERMTIGERQQLEIARLISLGAKMLILDEPTTGISAEQKETLFNALRRLAAEDGMTIILVSHKLEDVVALCDHAYVLRAGRLVGERAMPAPIGDLVALMFGDLHTQAVPPAMQPDHAVVSRRPALRIERLSIPARRFMVRDVSLTAYAGEVIGLAGLDGSGQADFLRACAGLQAVSEGRIFLDEHDVTAEHYAERMGRGVAFAPAGRLEEGLVPGFTLAEHFALARPGRLWVDRQAAQNDAARGIAQYHIRGRPDSPIQTLSGGNQQRVLIALLPETLKVLLLEDPTRGLDVESTDWAWGQLLARRAQGTTILFSSPDLDEIVAYSQRVIVFYGGRATLIDDVRNIRAAHLGSLIGGKAE